LTRKSVPDAPNFLLSLRFRVLAEVIAALPRQLRARHRFADRRGREAVWRRWRGVECGPP
ncbi:MAG: hypothetical protein J2O49_06275, partial [Sciscionella sp.]|nr:hypothetical protein [Sciscionella sp.]